MNQFANWTIDNIAAGIHCCSYDERSPACLLEWRVLSVFAVLFFLCCIARCSPSRGARQRFHNHSLLLSFTPEYLFILSSLVFTPCVWFLPFRVSHSVISVFNCLVTYVCIYYLFASFSVTRVSHDDEAKRSRERAPDPLWVTYHGWRPRE